MQPKSLTPRLSNESYLLALAVVEHVSLHPFQLLHFGVLPHPAWNTSALVTDLLVTTVYSQMFQTIKDHKGLFVKYSIHHFHVKQTSCHTNETNKSKQIQAIHFSGS